GNNLGDDGADGTLEPNGANIAVTAGTYKITMNLSDNTYTMEAFSWGIVGSGYNDWGATPDAKFTYDYVTNTFKVGVKLVDGEIKFRKNNDWGENFGDTGANGTLDAGGDNIVVTAGFYAITLDLVNGTYTMESANIWGVVGSGYNDWGATPDFSFTPLSNDIWVAEIVPIVDGEIKFRVNEDWGTNYGDTGVDGTLDAGGDNIAVTAGNYRIKL
ncbi:MAG: SusF/SusE family outer membrane protein, partial [Muricauda sp.]|nr:SusF/SusE family outer membrane protein [Allomuricauda sp.]